MRVKGGDFAQGETGDEEQAAPGEGAGDFPGLVVDVEVDVVDG